MQPESKFVHVNGIRMHYLDWGGDGRTCLMIHGTGFCGGVWEPEIRRISHRLRCLTLDLRSHGDTERTDVPITWELIADDIAGFYEALDLRDTFLVGHSRGGGAMMLAVSRAPERFVGAYVVEPSLLAHLGRTPEEHARQRENRRNAGRKRAVFGSRQEMFDAYKGRRGLRYVPDESLWAFVNHGAREREDGTVELKLSPEVEGEFHPAPPKENEVWAAARRLSFPLTLVYGRDSTFRHDIPNVTRFVELSRATLELVPGTHNTPLEYPDIHSRLILDLLDRVEREGRLPGRPAD